MNDLNSHYVCKINEIKFSKEEKMRIMTTKRVFQICRIFNDLHNKIYYAENIQYSTICIAPGILCNKYYNYTPRNNNKLFTFQNSAL